MTEGHIENGVYYYYLQDHQGNNRVMINSSGAVQEYSNYYPDGMRFLASTSDSLALPYRYNGKELEAMNGLNQSDYGARRKYSWGSVLPTIDPLCEKYYWITPYAYCRNNPINATDPDGLTDYNVNSNGNVYVKPDKEITTEYGFTIKIYTTLPESKPGESDTFSAVDEKGNATGASYTVANGVQMKPFDGKGVHADEITVSNNRDGKGLFEFMADNTHVEWSHFELDNGSSILSSSHDLYNDNSAPNVYQSLDKGSVTRYTHSHPLNPLTDVRYITDPSGKFFNYQNKRNSGDEGFIGNLMTENSALRAYIYVPIYHTYFEYNTYGRIKNRNN